MGKYVFLFCCLLLVFLGICYSVTGEVASGYYSTRGFSVSRGTMTGPPLIFIASGFLIYYIYVLYQKTKTERKAKEEFPKFLKFAAIATVLVIVVAVLLAPHLVSEG